MSEIKDEKIKRIIKAGINSKKQNPGSDLTPLSYKWLEQYIVYLETKIISLGGELPRLGHY